MSLNVPSRRAIASIAIATAIAFPAAVSAQTYSPAPMSDAEVEALPVEYQTGPVATETPLAWPLGFQ